jgi:hypothetical protein
MRSARRRPPPVAIQPAQQGGTEPVGNLSEALVMSCP